MRVPTRVLLALPLFLVAAPAAFGDDAAEKLAAQKKAAEANWEEAGAGKAAFVETDHLLIYAPASYEKRLKDIGATLEKQFEVARRPLGYEKAEPWPGKAAVYLIPERDDFTKFVRRVQKRRIEADDAGSYWVEDDFPHAVGGPPRAKTDPPVEGQAGEQLAAALLARKAGAKVPLPGWFVSGFGRATFYRARPNDKIVGEERRKAALLVRKGHTAQEVWGSTLEAEDAPVLSASLADFLAYGPGQSKFVALVEAFRPGENEEKKTTEQALQGVMLMADRINTRWREWAVAPK
jgi:hypothetical protein